METITEGKAQIYRQIGKISKKLDIFYNPESRFQRDMTILLLKSVPQKNLQISDTLAGSGIRSLRLLKELPGNKIRYLCMNDNNDNFFQIIKKHLELNKIKQKIRYFDPAKPYPYKLSKSKNVYNKNLILKNKINVFNEEASQFMLKNNGFDYIDIDPFGSPNPFLDSAIKRISRNGILAITATDTAALSGTFKKTCKRKYWATPLHNELMHETGLRILIRKIQLIGAQYEKALIPVFCFYKDHYFRLFLQCRKGKKQADNIMKNQGFFVHYNNMQEAGPLWLGKLHDSELLKTMIKTLLKTEYLNNKESALFLQNCIEENKIAVIGFFDVHKTAKQHKLVTTKKNKDIIKELKKRKHKASLTHFSKTAIKTDAKLEEFLEAMKK